MNATSPLLALSLTVMAFWPATTPQAAKPSAQGGSNWPWGNSKEADRISTEFCGVWQLTRVEINGQTFGGGEVAGHLIAVPNYCSLVARITERSRSDPRRQGAAFDAGSYKWHYDEGLMSIALEAQLQGNDFADGVIRYESGGARRDYRVSVTSSDLILDRGGNNRLFFQRVQKAMAPQAAATPAGPDKPKR